MPEYSLVLEEETHGFDWWVGIFVTDNPSIRVKVAFERLSDGDNGAIWCEAQIWLQISGTPHAVIPPSRTNLMNASRGGAGWKGLIGVLEDMAGDIMWDGPIAHAVGRAIEVYRTGELERELGAVEAERHHPFLLEPFIAGAGVSVFYGEGGTGKSLLALTMAVAVASGQPMFGTFPQEVGPVVYFDYEDDHRVHEERLSAILKGASVELQHPIYHRALVAKVSQSQATMRRSVADRDAKLAVLDSIGMGRGGDANTAEDTIRLFRALRSLEVPVLAIDHVNKQDKRQGKLLSPYGSVYTINSARMLWGAVVAEGASTPTKKYLNCLNTKANRVAIHPPMGLSLEYVNVESDDGRERWLDQVRVDAYDQWWDEQEPAVWDQIAYNMELNSDKWWTINELALKLELERTTVEKAIQRNLDGLDREKKGRAYSYQLRQTNSDTLSL